MMKNGNWAVVFTEPELVVGVIGNSEGSDICIGVTYVYSWGLELSQWVLLPFASVFVIEGLVQCKSLPLIILPAALWSLTSL